MLDLLTRLADKSLLAVDHRGHDARYHLLATVRDYARERLAEAGEEVPTRRAHLRCFVDLVERAEQRIEYREQHLRGDLHPGSLSRGGGRHLGGRRRIARPAAGSGARHGGGHAVVSS